MTYKDYLLSKGLSKATSESYYKNLLQYILWCEINQTEPEQTSYNELMGYLQYLKNKAIKQRTIQIHLNSLKHYFNWLVKRELTDSNPALNIQIKGIKRKVLHHILSKQELEKLYFDYKNLQSETLSKKRNEIIVSLLIYQGLNTNDLQNLSVKDVKLREGKIFIQGSRKSNERTLKLESHQILDFMEYTLQVRPQILAATKKQTDVYLVSTGSSLKLHNVMQKLMGKLHKQNKQVQSVQQIRASVITGWLKVYNLREVQYFAGHRYVSSTENYLINDLEDLKEDIGKYHPIG